MSKQALVVFAHQEPEKSFNGAMKSVAVQALAKQGFNVVVSDLYGQNFDPRATKKDFKGPLKNPDCFSYEQEADHAYKTGTVCDELMAEVEKVRASDLIVFQTPMYGSSIPAILKGYLDKISMTGFTFIFPDNIYDNGLLRGKKAVLSITTGGPESFYTPFGMDGDINIILWPILNGLRWSGMDILKAQVSHVGPADTDAREKMLQSWSRRLEGIMAETPIQFIPTKNFDPNKDGTLCQEFRESVKDDEKAPTVGPLKNPDCFSYEQEAAHAYKTGTVCDELMAEVEKVRAADLIVFQTPMYHGSSMPAILKGYLDKISMTGFTFFFPDNIYDNGLLRGKKAVLSITTGGPESSYTPFGMNGDINIILWPILNGLRWSGMDILKAQVSNVGPADKDAREKMLQSWSRRLEGIMAETPIQFIPTKNFDPNKDGTLCQEFRESVKDDEKAPTVGQHMFKRIESSLVFKDN